MLLAANTGYVEGIPTRWEAPRTLSPAERESARAAVGALKASLIPATMDQIMQALMELRLHGRNAPGKDGLPLLLDGYARLLREVPADILWTTKDRHLATSPFWPAPADLLAVAQPLLDERKSMLARAEKLAAGCDETPRRYQPTGDERKRMADGFKRAADVLRNMPGPAAA